MKETLSSLYPLLGVSFMLGYALLVWFRTNAFAEYVTLFRLTRFFHVGDYNEVSKNGYPEGYVHFLKEYYHDNFIVRLVTCPVCFGFWLGLIIFFGFPVNILVVPLGLFFYGVLNKLV
jgi:hypothetical protein